MGGWRFASFMFGFVAAVLVLAASNPAHAQTIPNDPLSADDSKLIGPTYPTASSRPDRTRPKFQALDEDYAAPGIPPPIPESDPTQDPEERDLLDPGPRAGQRPVVQDGDLNYTPEPASPVDGNLDTYTEEPEAPIDGVDTSVVDTRDASDVALFQNPPAPRDPLLYQIEDLDPIRDDRTISRLFRQEPYDPVGIKVGSFVLFPELDFGTSYYSNVFHAPKAESDVALDLVPSARLVSNWDRHALEFRASGVLSWFNEYQTEDDRDYLVEARGRLDITRRANIQALLSRQRFFEDRSALDASSVGTRAEVLTDRAEAAYNQRFNRLSFQLRGSVNDYTYGDTETAGVVSSNADRDYTAYEQTARVSWEFKPTLAPFVEVAINQREYSEPAASDGINRSSKGQRYRVGLSFGNTGRIWRGEVSLGYGIQTYDDPRLHPVDGLTIDANATWRITDITSILFNASTDVAETTTTDVGGAFSYYASIELRHELQSYLVATAGLIYSNQNSQDGVIKDNELRETLGLEYYANRNWILYGRYAHVNFDGVGIPNDYVGDEFHVGVKWRR
jgi:hypothetical protein